MRELVPEATDTDRSQVEFLRPSTAPNVLPHEHPWSHGYKYGVRPRTSQTASDPTAGRPTGSLKLRFRQWMAGVVRVIKKHHMPDAPGGLEPDGATHHVL